MKARQAPAPRTTTEAAAQRPAAVREAPLREAEAPTTRDRMEAAFGGASEWTTRERIRQRAHAEEPEPPAPEPELEETTAEPEPMAPRLVLVPPLEDAHEASAPTQTVEPFARGPPLAAVVQAKLTVSSPGDPLEREADLVAARVLRAVPVRPRPELEAAPIRGPPAATPGLPRSVASVVAAPGGGRPLDAAIRERIEPHVGIDLSHVRVRQGPDAATAARDLHARAFTSGSTIFLAAGSSPADVGLMAHEATHVAQQRTVAAARTTLMRDVTDVLPDISVGDVIPDWILDGVREAVRAIPGYVVLTYIAGRDPLSDEPAPASPQEVIEALLTRGPFGAAVGTVLQSIDVLGDVFGFVMDGLAANDLTLARIQRDIESAWDELSVTNGISGNVAIVARYVDALLRDVAAFVDSIVERVLEVVRAVVADVAEPLLETDAIAPLWNLVKKVLRYDPLRGVAVEAPTAEIIADFLRLIGEEERLAQMQERGTLQATADWLDTQLGTFASLATELGTLFDDARAAIQPQNLPDLLTNLEALAWRAFGFIQGVGLFAGTLILKVLELVKESLLAWLSENAHSLPGFHLLTVIVGQNPFTGEEVPRTAENLIKGFITLLPGGEATYEQLAESGVISSAAARIEGEMGRLGITLELVTGTFRGIWDTLTLDDLLAPLDAFARILAQFGEPLARLVEFAAVVVEVVVTLILRLMNFPSELLGSVISNTLAAIEDIRRDPVAFLLNMVEAIKLGFTGFFDNIGRYLLDGLVAWLFRGLGQLGITLPPDFSLASILTFVFQVLGLSIEHLWEKLGEHIGPERVAMIRGALDKLAGAWAFIQDVQREGLPAIWRYVKDQLSGIWSTLLTMATEWIMQAIIVNATVKLLSFIDPSGIMATINTCIAIFNAIMSAIEYMRDMLEVFNQYVMTLAAVAAGNIVPGAQMLEMGLAAIIPIAIGFLAKQVGIGNIPEKIAELIGSLREIIDAAIDWLIEQALRLGQAALNALGLGERRPTTPEGRRQAAVDEVRAAMTRGIRRSQLVTLLAGLRTRLELRRCELVGDADVVIENSPAETVDGVLAWSPDEIEAATGVRPRMPGRGGRDMVLGFYESSGETLPTVRAVLEPYRARWAAWEAGGDPEAIAFVRWSRSLANLPADAFRPSHVRAEFRGVLEFASGGAGGRGAAQGQVGDMGDLEYSIRRENWSTGKYFQGGHVIASELAGPETFDNLVPMREDLNERLYRDVEMWVVRNLPSVFPGENPRDLPMVAELDWTMTYPPSAEVALDRLGQLVASEIAPGARPASMSDAEWQERIRTMREARKVLRASLVRGEDRVEVPTRVPTRIGLHARFSTGEAPAGTPPPTTPAPTAGAAPPQTRTLDPLITLPTAPAATAAAATVPSGGAATATVALGPWEQRWTFTQST